MMIAEVGDIEKVSGSRIATPLAPPRPGSTPMMTPSTMPTHHQHHVERLQHDRKAVKQIADIFHGACPSADACMRWRLVDARSEAEPVLDRPLGSGTRNQISNMKKVDDRHADRDAPTVVGQL